MSPSTHTDKRGALYAFFSRPFWTSPRTLLWLWVLLPIIAGIAKMGKHNNYLIFRYVFWHLWDKLSLYELYPHQHNDHNHYGPAFAIVVAPFALLPDIPGHFLWLVALSLWLFWSIRLLPLPERQQIFVYWFTAHQLLTALFMAQFNIAIAAIIVGSFVFIEREQEGKAAFLIVLGTFVKLYGIVGLAFFFFSKHRLRFIGYLALWSVVWFALPMLLSSPEYIVGQYVEWFTRLASKNSENMFSLMQNVSLLGMIRKISGCATYSDLWIIIPGLILFGLPYLRLEQYRYLPFRLALLSSVLMFVVLFSTGSESSTYIIPFVGIGIWYISAPWKRSVWEISLLVLALVVGLSNSDLFPRSWSNELFKPYALKALPTTIIWLQLVWEMCTRDYSPTVTGRD